MEGPRAPDWDSLLIQRQALFPGLEGRAGLAGLSSFNGAVACDASRFGLALRETWVLQHPDHELTGWNYQPTIWNLLVSERSLQNTKWWILSHHNRLAPVMPFSIAQSVSFPVVDPRQTGPRFIGSWRFSRRFSCSVETWCEECST
jgi:hypothetical protein